MGTIIDVAYPANATDVQSQVLQLKEKKPDVVLMITYTSDAILFARTMQAQDYKPPMLLADDAGYSDPSFLKATGKISQGTFNRSSWSVGPAGSHTALIAKMYKEKRSSLTFTDWWMFALRGETVSGRVFSVILLPTSECNVACDYCFERKEPHRLSPTLLPLLTRRLLDHLENEHIEECEIYWQGGEAMIMGPAWFENAGEVMNRAAAERGRQFVHYLQTNLISYSRPGTE